jgi:hypothetical protein
MRGEVAMKRNRARLLLLSCVFILAAPAFAHHSFEAEFDIDKPLTLTGVLTGVEWINPHVYLHVDVKDSSDKVTNWRFETLPPVMLRSGGLERSMLHLGEALTIDGYSAKDGSKFGWASALHLMNGSTITLITPLKPTKAQ